MKRCSFFAKILAQTPLQESAGHVRKVDFDFFYSSVNKHPNKFSKITLSQPEQP
jgi:hypothetical protein